MTDPRNTDNASNAEASGRRKGSEMQAIPLAQHVTASHRIPITPITPSAPKRRKSATRSKAALPPTDNAWREEAEILMRRVAELQDEVVQLEGRISEASDAVSSHIEALETGGIEVEDGTLYLLAQELRESLSDSLDIVTCLDLGMGGAD